MTQENVNGLRLLAEEFRLVALVNKCDPEPDERVMNEISRLQDQRR
jgi:hypothetical protein